MTSSNVVRFPVERRLPVRLLTLRELQERTGMSERFWRYRIAEGCPVHRYGNRLRLDASEVEAWMREREHGAA